MPKLSAAKVAQSQAVSIEGERTRAEKHKAARRRPMTRAEFRHWVLRERARDERRA